MEKKLVNNWWSKFSHGFNKKTIKIISLLAIADILVMLIPFYLKNVLSGDTIAKALGIGTDNFSQANAIYGYVALLSYFIGGYFADRINLKKLVLIGLFSVGIFSIWYAMIPFIHSGKIIQLYLIFASWSFITCFIFWSALWKILAEQGKPEDNGKLNGLHGSLNGLIGTVIVVIPFAVIEIVKASMKLDTNALATIPGLFTGLVLFFTAIIFIACFFLWKMIPDSTSHIENKDSFNLKVFIKTLKNYKLWLVTILIMGVYLLQSGLSVVVRHGEVLGVVAIVVTIVGILRTYFFRFVFSSMAGRWADKTQNYIKFIVIGLAIALILLTALIVMPGFDINKLSSGYKTFMQVAVMTLFALLGIACWCLVTNRWATIYQIGINQKEYAVSVGFISFIAFSPDAWFWQIDSALINKFGRPVLNEITNKYENVSTLTSNQISLAIIAGITALAGIAGIILLYVLHKEKQLQMKQNKNVLYAKK